MPNPLQMKIELATEQGDHGKNAVHLRNAVHYVVEQFNVVANAVEIALDGQRRAVEDEVKSISTKLSAEHGGALASLREAMEHELASVRAAVTSTLESLQTEIAGLRHDFLTHSHVFETGPFEDKQEALAGGVPPEVFEGEAAPKSTEWPVGETFQRPT